MAKTSYLEPYKDITGAVTRNGIVNRKKVFRDANGKIIRVSESEVYRIEHPRDFTAKPPTGNELAHHNRWREACRRTLAELRDPGKRAEWQQLFEAQLRTPAPNSPEAVLNYSRKQYVRLDAFVRASIYAQLKAQPDTKAQDNPDPQDNAETGVTA